MTDWQHVLEQNEIILDGETLPADSELVPEEFILHDNFSNFDLIGTPSANPQVVLEPDVHPSNAMQDDLLPNIPAHMYYKLLDESIARKRFFNAPIHVHEELFKFKTKTSVHDVNSETEEVTTPSLSIKDLTNNSFEFITARKFVHLKSSAGTGKTMAMFQLAKSLDLDQRHVVPVMCKGKIESNCFIDFRH